MMKLEKLSASTILRNGTIIDPVAEKQFKADVLIEDGRIAGIGGQINHEDAKSIDCSGLIITHGFCDLHVHFREPGREDKETLATGSRAALAGGFTRVCVMPNTDPPIDTPEAVANIIDKARELPVHIHPIGAVTHQQQGRQLTEMGSMRDSGSVAFSDDGLPITNGSVMRMALEYGGMLNVPVINHAEDIDLLNDGLMNEGAVSTRLGLPGNPAAAEINMVHRDLELARTTSTRLHVPHVSTAGAARLIGDLKKQHDGISAEVTPHHLFFNDEDLLGFDTNLKVAPPIRSEADRQGLITAIRQGVFECIATDHAPHTTEEKEGTFDLAPFGMIGLESCFGAVNRILVNENDLPLMELIKMLTVNPRNIMGFDNDLLTVGEAAELVVVDTGAEYEFSRAHIQSKSVNSPYMGRQLTGKIHYTISKGNLAVVQ